MEKLSLVAALNDPETKGRRGDLVYALKKHPCNDLVPLLVNCVLEGSYEEVQHALDILWDTEADLPDAVANPLIERLDQACKDTIDWRRDALVECRDLFE